MFSKQHYVSTLAAKCDRARRMVWRNFLSAATVLISSSSAIQSSHLKTSCHSSAANIASTIKGLTRICYFSTNSNNNVSIKINFPFFLLNNWVLLLYQLSLHTIKLVSLPSLSSSSPLSPVFDELFILLQNPDYAEMLTGTLPAPVPSLH